MKAKSLIIIAAALICGGYFGYSFSGAKALQNYHDKTEILLDSLNNDHPFADGVAESDAYCDYMAAEKHLNGLNDFTNK